MDAKRYRIVYEDEQLIVVDKPSGMLVIPTPKKETNTLTDLLNRELDKRGIKTPYHSLRSGTGHANAHPCHRLDRETSGLIVYAKGKSIQQMMMEEFKKRAVKKTYIAFVNGSTTKDFDIIKKRIYNRNKNRSDEAVTKYKTVERLEDFTVVEVEPVTGRTNQIRIHFKEIGHPLVGESVFAFRKDFKLKFKRAALHAAYIRFTHPVTKRELDFSAPMPGDMEGFLNKIRNTNDERRTTNA
jgi:23S rRNA pseudouridine1911/1915/1917 synthase